jgi:hypothetical protein
MQRRREQCQVKIKDDDGNEVTCGKRIAKKFPPKSQKPP